MSYTALYRKYRPMTFGDMIGQEDVTQVIKNQIISGSTSHAYIFSGTRGTGKTTTAKILARAINCLDPRGYEPCNVCEVCRSIMDESIMDVIEMDAASNNGVDDVREIRENCKFPPSKAKKKVYIIDEVHMLSNGAFNALLKTLEEPPSYMVFILATTEPHKIPVTIMSRCQKYNFSRVTNKSIMELLISICEKEGIEYDKNGIELISRKSEGSVRDALSILDQCASSGSGAILCEVKRMLSGSDDSVLIDTAQKILEHDLAGTLINVDGVLKSGANVNQFTRDLQDVFRDILIVYAGDSAADLIEKSDSYVSELTELRKGLDIGSVINAIDLLAKAPGSRINLEIALARLCVEEQVSTQRAVRPAKETKIETQKVNKPDREVARPSTDALPSDEPVNERREEGGRFELEDVKSNWEKVLSGVKKRKVTISAFLVEGKPHEVIGNRLIIAFPDGYGFHMSAIMKEENKSIVEDVLKGFFNRTIRIDCNFLSILQHKDGNDADQDDNIEKVKELFSDYIDVLKIEE